MGCPWCLKHIYDDDTIQEKDGVTWHASCKDAHDAATRRRGMFGAPDPSLTQEMNAKINAKVREEQTTIFYTMTPDRFRLDIPVGALANLSPDAHTRILAMVTDWINRHKPITITPVPKGTP